MRDLLLRTLKLVLALAGLLLLLALAGGYFFLARTFPQTGGTIQMPGLMGRVEVIRDQFGVPHIYASNADDLFMAQGYVHAQDRLWQMELNRHVAHGQISELFGDAKYSESMTTVEVDRFLRTLGLDRASRADLAVLDPATGRALQKYADGVNAFLHSHPDTLPLEFSLLGIKMADWQPVDTIAWGKVMAYNLDGNYEDELFRRRLIDAIGPQLAAQLYPAYPVEGPFIIPPSVKSYAAQQGAPEKSIGESVGQVDLASLSQLDRALTRFGLDTGSNSWVIDGSQSVTNKPLLANDPHLGISMPSIWYANALHCQPVSPSCPYDVAGSSFPGTPGIVVGHNARVAWGVTTPYVDVQDLYVEKVNPDNPNQYWFGGQWNDMKLEAQTVRVKGGQEVPFTIRYTGHGPILTPVVKNLTATVALQWVATRERSTLEQAVLAVDKAQNWDEFRDALRLWDFPSQNFVYADVDGNIGYQLPGKFPIRARGDGTAPVDGASGEYEWKGYIPFDDLPFLFNPSSHAIWSANNQIVPSDFKYFLSRDYAAPFRARRIGELIGTGDKLSVQDFARMQGDIYSLPLTKLQKYVTTIKPTGFLGERAMKWVKEWDGSVKEDSIGAAILEVAYVHLIRDLFSQRLGPDLARSYASKSNVHRLLVDQLLDDPKNALWDNPETPAVETRDDRLKDAYLEGVDWLGSQYGDWPPEWQWGRLHTATFAHPFGSIKPLDLILNSGPMKMPADGFTVNKAGFDESTPYATTTISSMREIIDLADFDRSLWIHGAGQSGLALSSHYADLTSLWREVKYAPLYFTRSAVEAHKADLLVLDP